MGIISRLFEGISRLIWGNTQLKQFNCEPKLEQLKQYPTTMSEYCRTEISRISTRIEQSYENANSKEFSIAIVGDFSVGKSSFVNALLSKNIVPVSAKPCTAAITSIIYGGIDHVVLCHETKGERVMSIKQYKSFSSYSLEDLKELDEKGTLSRFEGISRCTIHTDSLILKNNNLCIIDTLGLSANENDTNRTLEAIKGAIAIIYLCTERGLTAPDRSFITKYLHPESSNFFLCINRIDRLSSSGQKEVISGVRLGMDSILKEITGSSQNTFPLDRLFAVSSLFQNFANGFETDSDDYNSHVNYAEKSGFSTLIDSISKYVNTCSENARNQYLNNQLSSIRESVHSLKELRLQELEMIINQLQSSISELLNQKDNLESRIHIIELKYETILGKLILCVNRIKGNCIQRFEATWEQDVRGLIRMVHFTKGDYLKLCAYRMNFFLSEREKEEKAREVLRPFTDVIISHTQKKLNAFIVDEITSIKMLSYDYFNSEGLVMPDLNTPIYYIKEPRILDIEQCKLISNCIWNQLTRNGVFLSSSLALLEWCLGISTSDSQIVDIINGTKETVIGEINKSLDVCCCLVEQRIEQLIDECKKKDTFDLYKKLENIQIEIKNNETELEQRQHCSIEEQAYFEKTCDILIL